MDDEEIDVERQSPALAAGREDEIRRYTRDNMCRGALSVSLTKSASAPSGVCAQAHRRTLKLTRYDTAEQLRLQSNAPERSVSLQPVHPIAVAKNCNERAPLQNGLSDSATPARPLPPCAEQQYHWHF